MATLPKLPTLVVAGVLMLACGPTVQYSATQQPPRPLTPRPPNEVEVFNAEAPDRAHVAVGVLTARQSGSGDPQALVSALQTRAGKVGCDGIIIAPQQGKGPLRASCIVFTEPAADTGAVAAKTEEEKPKEDAKTEEPAAATDTPSAPPDGSAGFTFGQSVDEARAKCRDAKFRWRQVKGSRYSCSGTPVPIGSPATMRFRFCEGRLCEINVDADRNDPGVAYPDAFRQTRDALAQKYGQPKKTSDTVGAECVDAELAKCVTDARADMSAEWWWPSGERIIQKLAPGEKAKSVVVQLTYTKWPLNPPAGAAPAPPAAAPAQPPAEPPPSQ